MYKPKAKAPKLSDLTFELHGTNEVNYSQLKSQSVTCTMYKNHTFLLDHDMIKWLRSYETCDESKAIPCPTCAAERKNPQEERSRKSKFNGMLKPTFLLYGDSINGNHYD